MNFVTFPVSGTNIFPISNSKLGGQLLTEFNLRSIDTVATPSNLSYSVGPSFVHGKNDFDVQIQQDSSGNIINADTLETHPASYFATASDMSALQTNVSTNTSNIATNTGNITSL